MDDKRWVKFFGTEAGRDKSARVLQFAGRMAEGFLTTATDQASKELLVKVKAMNKVLADTRSTLRWFKWLPVIETLRTMKEVSFELLSKICLALFAFFSNIRWLQQLKFVSGDPGFAAWSPTKGNGKFANSFLAMGSFFGLLSELQKLSNSPDDSTKVAAAQKAAFRNALMTYQGLHLSKLYESDNKWVGLAGMISSLIDCQGVWKRTNPPAKK